MAERRLPLSFAPGEIHRCVACGSSCMHAPIGPITRGEIDQLDLERLRVAMPDLPELLWYTEENPFGGEPNYFFRSFNRRCVFLTESRLCGIQQHLGLDVKPRICQLFPLVIIETPEGIVVSDSLECRMSMEHLRAGGDGDRPRIERLADSEMYRERVGETVAITADLAQPYADYRGLEAALLDAFWRAPGLFESKLVAVNGTLMNSLGIAAPRIAADDFETLFRTLLQGFATHCANVSALASDPIDRHRWLEIANAIDAMGQWLDVTDYPRDDAVEALLARAFVQQLTGKQFIAETSLVDGLARFNFKHLLILGLAAFRGTAACRHKLELRDVTDALVVIQLLSRNPDFLGLFVGDAATIRLLFLECWQSPLAQTDQG